MNMKNNYEKGFALVEVLLIVLVVSVIGFGGYYVYTQNTKDKDIETASQSQNSLDNGSGSVSDEQMPIETEQSPVLKSDEVIYPEEGISLVTTEDLDKLPGNTPESFKTYLADNYLKQNDTSTDACVTGIWLTKLSLYNYGGSSGPNDNPAINGECEGLGSGKAMFGSPDQGATWEGLTGVQAIVDCDDVVSADLHYEFIGSCASAPGGNGRIDNPLGYLGSKADYDAYIEKINQP